jgi:hypothetical protein
MEHSIIGTKRMVTVNSKEYEVFSDFIQRATFAISEDGAEKAIKRSGYIHNELTVRKAIALAFGLESFRK